MRRRPVRSATCIYREMCIAAAYPPAHTTNETLKVCGPGSVSSRATKARAPARGGGMAFVSSPLGTDMAQQSGDLYSQAQSAVSCKGSKYPRRQMWLVTTETN